ncbi:myrosinase 1 [Anabrus simplex]|uniref:myrosinase 1 n=1 Tax=Anabrus simplex TaxID=316456 RepID=UPI0035A2FEDD
MSAVGLHFPRDFLFGAATASYQVEGAWNEDGKGENIWDRFVHEDSGRIKDHQNGDVAADSYHQYKKDVQALVEMGVDFYRFSVSWSRVLPTGVISSINQKGLEYYSSLVDELLANNIKPMVTIFHWDLPQPLQELGGWTNPILADYFMDYAKVLFDSLGDRVKLWLTFNEPLHVVRSIADWTHLAPGINLHTQGGDYLAVHTILKAHAQVYHLYDKNYRPSQRGRLGIALHSHWYEPKTECEADFRAVHQALQFDLGTFAHPILSDKGDLPPLVQGIVERNSKAEGRARSRCPTLDPSWVKRIKGTTDFLGLNHYSTRLVSLKEDIDPKSDWGVSVDIDPNWPAAITSHVKVVPWGLRRMLQYVKKEFGNPEVIITENGYADNGQLNDAGRCNFYKSYLAELLKAIHWDGCNVTGYCAWSLLDNFEWSKGYTERYGLYHVDYNHEDRPRTAKDSARMFRKIISTRTLD